MTSEVSTLDTRPGKREFRLEDEYQYNRSSAVRWIISHLLRYPYLPLIAFFAAVVNNFAYSTIQILVGRAFDLISTPGWATQALAALALGVFLAAVAQGATGLMRNYSTEIIANRVEQAWRAGRDLDMASLLADIQRPPIRKLGVGRALREHAEVHARTLHRQQPFLCGRTFETHQPTGVVLGRGQRRADLIG